MARKVIIIADPGIDGAFAIALALHDRELEVLALAATAGNVSPEQATRNIHILVEQMDPRRWPRIGAALPVVYELDGRQLHGPNGMGPLSLPCAQLHHPHPSDKLIVDLVRQHPGEITIVNLGPLTVLARALDRDAELAHLMQSVICLGGVWHEAGNVSPVAEFHFFCDPTAARQVIHCGANLTLIPLDVSRKVLLSPTDLLALPTAESQTCDLLRQMVPFGIGASANLYGVEGFQLKDVLGIVALTRPTAITTKPMVVDVETRGELTRGMMVVDTRWGHTSAPNVELAVNVDVPAVRKYIDETLRDT